MAEESDHRKGEKGQDRQGEPAIQSASASPFRALRHPPFRTFWVGQLISLTGSWMQGVGQRWLVYQLTGSESVLGIVNALMTLPVAVLAPFSGAIADRYEKRKILMTIQVSAASLAFILWFLTATGSVRISHLLVLALGLGLVRSVDVPTRQSFWADMVGKEALMSAVALNSAAVNLSRIIGPSVAGIVIAAVGVEICFLVNAISFAPSFLALLLMTPAAAVGREERQLIQSVREGLRFVRKHRQVHHLLLIIAFWSLFAGQFDVLLPVMAGDVFKAGPRGYGFMTAAIGLGAVAGAVLSASLERFQRRGSILLTGTVAASFSLFLFSQLPLFSLSLITLFLLGTGMVLQNATANTLVQTLVPDQMRGRVMGLYSLVLIGLAPIGSLFYGFMGERLGARSAFLWGSLLLLASDLLIHWKEPQIRHLR